jgi:hypothetical protein
MKHGTYAQYPADSMDLPQRALLTIWDCLADYRDGLVLVGGLAVRHLTHPAGDRGGEDWRRHDGQPHARRL